LGLVLDEPMKNEIPNKVNGIDVLIEEVVKDYANKSVVDYVNTPYGERFIVEFAGSISC
jgi:Fe-S cluster assembly iron-binding protein IscA